MNLSDFSTSIDGEISDGDFEEVRKRRKSTEEALQVPLNPREEDERDVGNDLLLSHPAFTKSGADSLNQNLAQLERFMNQGPHVILSTAPISRAYHLFITLGLRHLPVLDVEGRIVGILTRKDMLSLERYQALKADERA